MITLKAKFIGKSSLGFISNKEYELVVDSQSTEIHIEAVPDHSDRRTLKCVYLNTPKFLENWEVLSIDRVDNKSKHGTVKGVPGVATGTVTYTTSSITGYSGYSGAVGYSAATGYSGTVYSGATGYSGGTVGYSDTKDFQSIANEIRSDMRNNKLKKILTPLTNGKNSLV